MDTLRTLLEKHPEYADLPVAVSNTSTGELDYLDEANCGAGSVYIYGDDLSEEEIEDYVEELGHDPIVTLVFSGN